MRVGCPPLVEQLTKGYRPPIVAQRRGDIRADRLRLAIIDGLAGIPGELLRDRDGDPVRCHTIILLRNQNPDCSARRRAGSELAPERGDAVTRQRQCTTDPHRMMTDWLVVEIGRRRTWPWVGLVLLVAVTSGVVAYVLSAHNRDLASKLVSTFVTVATAAAGVAMWLGALLRPAQASRSLLERAADELAAQVVWAVEAGRYGTRVAVPDSGAMAVVAPAGHRPGRGSCGRGRWGPVPTVTWDGSDHRDDAAVRHDKGSS